MTNPSSSLVILRKLGQNRPMMSHDEMIEAVTGEMPKPGPNVTDRPAHKGYPGKVHRGISIWQALKSHPLRLDLAEAEVKASRLA